MIVNWYVDTVVGIGATVGIVAGAVVATTLAMKNKDNEDIYEYPKAKRLVIEEGKHFFDS